MKNAFRLLLAALFLLPLFALANGLPDARHIQVSGTAYVEALPDYVEISLSISETASTLEEARKAVDVRTRSVLEAAASGGVLEEDIDASLISAQPEYEYANRGRVYKGERVNRSVTLRLRDLERYSELVQKLTGSGITRLEGISLHHSKISELKSEAMKLAIADAKTRAEIIAAEFGASVGAVYGISAQASGPSPVFRGGIAGAAAMSAESAQADQGAGLKIAKQKIHQSIYAVFTLN
ncbi:SIMPL domain-containing protein [Biformimicrobium ophioploci]|uniref:Oxidative stress defense protein n=1 Tax=Biformimicrobium ophioploci TaxID=3036711 RepID=A0ABQ6M282_9GAMM|nr:SIMPL domain-containing protein [Microbulbifer sp. NKW57]GMG88443.1 oxidative stress defense protein [Microbulbifer sp. NKW57]